MKKRIVTYLLFAASIPAMAEDYQYLTVTRNSTEKSIELACIKKITFEANAGNVVVTTTEGEERFPLSEMEKMFFSVTPTAIEAMPMQSEGMKLVKGELKVKGEGMLRIYNASGSLQRMAQVKGETSISLENLPSGTYIVNLGNQTIKFKK